MWRDSFTYFRETGLTYKGIRCGTRIMLVWALQPLKTTTQTTSYLDGQRHPETSIPQLKDSFVCASKFETFKSFGTLDCTFLFSLSSRFRHRTDLSKPTPRSPPDYQETRTQEDMAFIRFNCFFPMKGNLYWQLRFAIYCTNNIWLRISVIILNNIMDLFSLLR
jgi:hypothetical protein